MSDRRKFTLEFKIEAAHRVIDSGREPTLSQSLRSANDFDRSPPGNGATFHCKPWIEMLEEPVSTFRKLADGYELEIQR